MTSQDAKQITQLSAITITKQLNQAKYAVYLAHSRVLDCRFALKIFPFANNKVSPHFLNEVRFSNLSHSNIISIFSHIKRETIRVKGELVKVSCTLMTLAPYGDFYDLLLTRKITLDEKLVRTYFHQLVSGLEYLHLNRVAHLDIKPDNLLIGDNYQLKIADFDCSVMTDDGDNNISTGTLYYRAPEIIKGICKNTRAADVYSSAIVLFMLMCGGHLPHLEHQSYQGCNLLDLLENDNEKFWQKHCEIQNKDDSFFSESFRSLFNSMTKTDPIERSNLVQVRGSEWFNKPIYSDEELVDVMKRKMH